MNSFAIFVKNESKMVFYLNYDNIDAFRKLRFHSVVIFWYLS